MIHYSHCPVCLQGPVHPAFQAVDHSVSLETFDVWMCDHCTAAFTQNIPGAGDIGRYYASAKYISHSDTQEGIVNKLYHRIRNITLKNKRKLVEQKTGRLGGNLLDIGAGTGSSDSLHQIDGPSPAHTEHTLEHRSIHYGRLQTPELIDNVGNSQQP